MRKLNGFILGCTIALLAGTASAQVNTVDIIVTDSAQEQMVIPNSAITTIQVLPKSGQVLITLNEDYVIEPATPCVDCEPPPATAVINSFDATSPIIEGEATVPSWVTTDANLCTAASGPGDWTSRTLGTQSAGTSVVIDTAGNYTFTMTCVGDDEVVKTATTSVVVDTDVVDPPTDCTASPLGEGVDTSWKNVWGVDFPGPTNAYRNPVIPRNSYMSLEFNTGTVWDNGYIGNTESTRTAGVKLVAIANVQVISMLYQNVRSSGVLEDTCNGQPTTHRVLASC